MRRALPPVTLLIAWVLALALSGSQDDVALALAPLVVLVSALLAGRYPGERILMRLVARSAPPGPCWTPPSPGTDSSYAAVLPRGGSLISSSRGGRAPPVAAAVQST
jgi:hypothetical protein